LSRELLAKTGLSPARRVKDLNDNDLLVLREALKDHRVEGDLRRDISMSIKRLIDTGTYRGTRHRKGLPARGQRTRTNARTLRGKRKTVGLGRKKEEEKKE
jgi:small subunit ribosomal protein S13